MNILISNDDGIDFVGLQVLVKAFSRLGDVYVTAPDRERSSNSHHVTIRDKVAISRRDVPYAKEAYALSGTPVDCVYLGLDLLYKGKIDLVVAGINKGANLSSDIVYSGTVAVAREAFMEGIPAVAVSLNSFHAVYYEQAAEYAVKITEKYLAAPDHDQYYLNINVPDLPGDQIKGLMVCDKACKLYYDNHLSMENIDGQDYICVNSLTLQVERDPDDLRVDYNAVNSGYVAVSPMHVDQYAHERVSELEACLRSEAL